jgi:hypothetical protein
VPVCPSFAVACLSELFRCLFVRAFPLPVCPSFSVACLSELFFSAVSFHPYLQTVDVSINQVRSQTQLNPQLLLLWGFVGFWFAQRGDIFRVRVPNIQFMALYLVFQKVGVYGIKILESI